MNLAEKAEHIYYELEKYYGTVEPALTFSSVYELTVAVILSAQTTDKQVNIVTPTLFAKYPDFEALSKAAIPDVEQIIHSTGFYRNKARNIVKLAQEISSHHKGILPDSIEKLIKLPGIGRKSANVIISQGFGKPGLAVDTHVGRIARRLGLSEHSNPDKVEYDLKHLLPERLWSNGHLLFIIHGRNLCDARKPDCENCPLSQLCTYPGNTL